MGMGSDRISHLTPASEALGSILQILVLSSSQSFRDLLMFAWGLEMFLEARMNLRKSKTTYPMLHNQARKICFILEWQPAVSEDSDRGLGCSFSSGPA